MLIKERKSNKFMKQVKPGKIKANVTHFLKTLFFSNLQKKTNFLINSWKLIKQVKPGGK